MTAPTESVAAASVVCKGTSSRWRKTRSEDDGKMRSRRNGFVVEELNARGHQQELALLSTPCMVSCNPAPCELVIP